MRRARAALAGAAIAVLGLTLVPAAAHALGDYVASVTVGDTITSYYTLPEAFAAANGVDAATVTLLEHAVVTDTIIPVTKSITFNLNTFDVEFKRTTAATRINVQGGSLNLTGSGKLYESTLDQYAPVMLWGNTEVTKTSEVTVGADVTLEGWAGLFLNNQTGSNNGMVANVYGTLQTNFPSTGTGLYVNGSITTPAVVPVINAAGANISGGPAGMYLAGSTQTTISNSTVTGTSLGIEVRAGSLTLNDSVVTGGTGDATSTGNGDGTTSTNTALAIAQHTTLQPLAVTVNGGSYTASAAVQLSNPQSGNAAMSGVQLDIQSGTFAGQMLSTNQQNTELPLGSFIRGGSFSAGLSSFLVHPDSVILVGSGPTPVTVTNADTARSQARASAEIDGRTWYFSTPEGAIAAAAGSESSIVIFPPAASSEIPAPTSGAELTVPAGGGTLTPGSQLTLTASGFYPGSTVNFTMYSTPVSLGSSTANGAGVASLTVTIPSNAAAGAHTILALGLNSAGTGVAASQFAITVGSSANSDASGVSANTAGVSTNAAGAITKLAATGGTSDGILMLTASLLLGAGVAAMVVRRSRNAMRSR